MSDSTGHTPTKAQAQRVWWRPGAWQEQWQKVQESSGETSAERGSASPTRGCHAFSSTPQTRSLRSSTVTNQLERLFLEKEGTGNKRKETAMFPHCPPWIISTDPLGWTGSRGRSCQLLSLRKTEQQRGRPAHPLISTIQRSSLEAARCPLCSREPLPGREIGQNRTLTQRLHDPGIHPLNCVF